MNKINLDANHSSLNPCGSRNVLWFKRAVVVLTGTCAGSAAALILFPIMGPLSILVGCIAGSIIAKFAYWCLLPSKILKPTIPEEGQDGSTPPATRPASEEGQEAILLDQATQPNPINEATQRNPTSYSFGNITVTLCFDSCDFLGQGSFAKVIRAQGTDGKSYAVRKPLPNVRSLPWAKARDEKLLKALTLVQENPYALHCLAFCKDRSSGFPTTIFPLAEKSLEQELQETILDSKRKKSIITDIFKGLAYLHDKQGVAHLDIKEDNMLVMPDRVVLCDFDSLSQRFGCIDENGVLFTSPKFVAPEARSAWDSIMNNTQGVANPRLDRGLLDVWAAAIVAHNVWAQQEYNLSPFFPIEFLFSFQQKWYNVNNRLVPISKNDVSGPIQNLAKKNAQYPKKLMENLLQLDPRNRWQASQAVTVLESDEVFKGKFKP